jgi:serine phosphatase RsbU (regulator of sigma subunit)
MPDVARLVAVVDLLVDDFRAFDRATIVSLAAEQAARLTRAGRACVAVEGPEMSFEAAYPRGTTEGPRVEILEADIEVGATTGKVRVAEPVDGEFSALDSWLVQIVARRVESQLRMVELHDADLVSKQVVHDAELAGRLQRALASADQLATSAASAVGDLRPARWVGGDVFDLIEADGDLVAVLADVSGKGAPASMVASALLFSVQHHVAALGSQPGRVLAAVGASMEKMFERSGRIATVVIAAVDSRAGVVRIASAGHHPVFVATGGHVVVVPATCPPLGVFVPRPQEHEFAFGSDSAVLLASDGLVDQCDPGEAPFGMERLAAAFAEVAAADPANAVASVLGEVQAHAAQAPQDDDRAAVVISGRGLA